MKIKYLLALLSASLLIVGCGQQHQTRHYRPLMANLEEIKIYKTHRTNSVPATVLNGVAHVASVANSNTSSDNNWIYWYIIYDSNTRSYYSAASTTPDVSYSSLTWSKMTTVEVETSQLGEATTEISSDYASIPEANSLDSMEGVPESSPSTEGDAGGGDGD